jgi:hypothetical protein
LNRSSSLSSSLLPLSIDLEDVDSSVIADDADGADGGEIGGKDKVFLRMALLLLSLSISARVMISPVMVTIAPVLGFDLMPIDLQIDSMN